MTTQNNPAIDLSTLTEEQLESLLAQKKAKKQDDVAAYKSLVNETIPVIAQELVDLSNYQAEVKASVFDKVRNILSMKSDVFASNGKKAKTGQQTHTFSDDRYSITIGYRINDGWDDTASIGVRKVEEFIKSLSQDANSAALVKMVFDLLKKDSKGNLRSSSVIKLENMKEDFKNSLFSEGVDIIRKAYRPARSCWFIEASVKNESGKPIGIPLSIAAVEFPAWFTFDYFNA